MTKYEYQLTEKYLDEYSLFCQNRLCDDECPVRVEHNIHPEKSCFMTYCELREKCLLNKPE